VAEVVVAILASVLFMLAFVAAGYSAYRADWVATIIWLNSPASTAQLSTR